MQPAEGTPRLVPMRPVPNPYTDEAPLVVRNRPWRDNVIITVLGIAFLVGASAYLIWPVAGEGVSGDTVGLLLGIGILLGLVLVGRNRSGRNRVIFRSLGIALLVGASAYLIWPVATEGSPRGTIGMFVGFGIPLGALLLWFMFRLGTGAVVALGDETISRVVRRPETHTTSYRVRDITGGIYAANVKYSALSQPGAELVLFVPGGRLLWLADGLSARDIGRIATALSGHHINEIPGQIRSRTLRVIMRQINTDR